jgi:tight adherence protein B
VPQRGNGMIGRFDSWFDRLIYESGTQVSPVAAFLVMIAAGLLVGGLLFLWQDNLLVASGGLAIGIVLAGALFVYLRRRRMQTIDNQLPEVLELIARAVRAGETLDQGIELVASTGLEPTATEFRHCVQQLKLGLSVDATLRSLTQRVPLPELRLFAAALVVQRRSGGSLALTLERFAKALRERHGYRRQMRSSTASARWSTMVIVAASLGILVYLFVWQPDYINSFLESRLGQTVFAVGIALQIIGILWVLTLTKPEV